MKNFQRVVIGIVCCILLTACRSAKQLTAVPAPLTLYQSIPDESEKKSLVGILSIDQIATDTAFGWYKSNLTYYKLDSSTVQTIRNNREKFHLVLFMGTWCHDSQQLVPKYLETLKAAGVDESHITIIGTDRSKHTIAGLHQAYGITNVPTMIVLQNGKELGRIVEYGNTTFVDKELGGLIGKLE